jgi:membrane-associated phospholipid phosphatase
MKKLLVKNKFYFGCLAFFILAGGLFTAFLNKGDAILYLNSYHTSWADIFFKYATILGEEPVYVVIVLLFLSYRMRYSLLVALTGFAVMGVSYASKLFFAEDRPLAFFRKLNQDDILNFVDGVKVYTGQTSFPSGHSMSAFALYSLLVFLLPPRKRLAAVLFLTALAVVVSRVYLVQHFLGDIYAGSIMGVVIAILVYQVNSWFEYQPSKGIDRPLFFRKRKAA